MAAAGALAAGPAAAAISIAGPPPEPRRVFAHYIVCCPLKGAASTVEDFADEIRQAQSQGIDGFALNCGSWTREPRYRAYALKIFAATASLKTDFKLFFSADWLTEDQSIAMISEFYDHPNTLRFAGKPVVSTFGGDSDTWKGIVKTLSDAGKPIFFVPFFYPKGRDKSFSPGNVTELVADNRFVDGFFYFGAAGSGEDIAKTSLRFGQLWRRAGKIYMAPVTPYYRGLGPRNFRAFETRGFEAMAREWESAVTSGAQWVEIVTWNDWGEDTYVEEFGAPSATDVWKRHWGQMLSHTAYLSASAYYIRWFKTGEKRVDRDDLYWFYRLAPHESPGFDDPENEMKAEKSPEGAGQLEDRIFVTVFLIAPAEIHIESGDRRYTFAVPAGVHHLSSDFALGAQKFSVERDGKPILAGEGAFPITEDNWANYNYLSGQAQPL